MLHIDEDTNLTTSAPGSKNEDDISNDEIINQASPVTVTPISDDKPLNIQCSTINESSILIFF